MDSYREDLWIGGIENASFCAQILCEYQSDRHGYC